MLNNRKIIGYCGFLIGFFYKFRFNKDTLEYPLSTIFYAAICGLLTYMGAMLVAGFLPEEFRFIIVVTAIASCVYYIYKYAKRI
jgi:uncharacterized ion transporter superfamily protein YfcC